MNVHYRFLHDQVQRAAYSLMDHSTQSTTHLRIVQSFLRIFCSNQISPLQSLCYTANGSGVRPKSGDPLNTNSCDANSDLDLSSLNIADSSLVQKLDEMPCSNIAYHSQHAVPVM